MDLNAGCRELATNFAFEVALSYKLQFVWY